MLKALIPAMVDCVNGTDSRLNELKVEANIAYRMTTRGILPRKAFARRISIYDLRDVLM